VHRFLNDDARRRRALQQLGAGKAEDAAIDHGETLEPPIGRDVRQVRVDLVATLRKQADERARHAPLVGADGEVVPDL